MISFRDKYMKYKFKYNYLKYRLNQETHLKSNYSQFGGLDEVDMEVRDFQGNTYKLGKLPGTTKIKEVNELLLKDQSFNDNNNYIPKNMR